MRKKSHQKLEFSKPEKSFTADAFKIEPIDHQLKTIAQKYESDFKCIINSRKDYKATTPQKLS